MTVISRVKRNDNPSPWPDLWEMSARLRFTRKIAITDDHLSRLGLDRFGSLELGMMLEKLREDGRITVRRRDAYLIVSLTGEVA